MIIEFYSNMEKEIRDPASSKFEKVCVRNKIISFSAAVINDFLGTPDVEQEEPLDYYDEIATFLTRGRMLKWQKRMPTSSMTSLYHFLHTICTSN